jgi:DUF4097 and DUF4098 domain-containing protein YvlB
MHARTLVVPLALLAALAAAQSGSDVTRLDLNGVTTLDARTFNGDVRFTVAPGAATLRAAKRGAVAVAVTRRGATLAVEARTRLQPCLNCRVDLEVSGPAGLGLALQTGNGRVSSHGAARDVSARSGNGDVEVLDAGRTALRLHSGNGGVTARAFTGRVEADTGNGPVTIQDATFSPGTRSVATTGNGALRVLNPRGPGGLSITGSSGTGRVTLDLSGFEVRQENRVVGGSFTATLAGANPATLDLRTGNGRIDVSGGPQ